MPRIPRRQLVELRTGCASPFSYEQNAALFLSGGGGAGTAADHTASAAAVAGTRVPERPAGGHGRLPRPYRGCGYDLVEGRIPGQEPADYQDRRGCSGTLS